MAKKSQYSVFLDDELWEEFRKKAFISKNYVKGSISEIIEQLIKEWLEKA